MAFVASQKMDAIHHAVGVAVNTFTITDTSNYLLEGLSVSDYVGILKVTVPTDNEIYENTDYTSPDITVGLGTKTLPLPLDVDDNPVTGNYVVVLTIVNKNTGITLGTNTTTYACNYQPVVIDIDLSGDGLSSTLYSEDITDYGTLVISRTHTVEVPDGSGISDTTSSAARIDYAANIWSGSYTTTITTDVTYSGTLLTISDELTGTETLMVYKLTRPTVYDAVTSLNEEYETALGTNPRLATTYSGLSNQIDGYTREYDTGIIENDRQQCYDALLAMALLLSPDFIDDLFTVTEEIEPFTIVDPDIDVIATWISNITSSTSELNYLDGADVTNKRVIFANGNNFTTDSGFEYDAATNTLNIPTGGKYTIGGVELPGTDLLSTANVFTNTNTFPDVVVTTSAQLPSNTSIGAVSSTELGYINGVTSNIQDQIDAIDVSDALALISSASEPILDYESTTGVFTLDTDLSLYDNTTSLFLTDYTVTESDVTAHQAALVITASQVSDFDDALAASFSTLFAADFATSDLVDLGTKKHTDLTDLPGSADGNHLSDGYYAIATQAASTTLDGYLSTADWNTFNGKLDALTASSGVDITASNVTAVPGEIDHDSLLNYVAAQHTPLDDTKTTDAYLWSAAKVISYVTDANVAFTDVTTNDASSTKHGFLPKLEDDTSKFLRSDGAWVVIPVDGVFLDSVIRMVVDNGFDPGAAPTNGDRYIIMDSGSIHANFGTIDKILDGNARALGNNDIVQYITSAGEFRIAYDASTTITPATVTVGTDINSATGHQWGYNIDDDVWVDRGSAGTAHNTFADLNTGVGDFYHVSSAEQTFIKAITSDAGELNLLDGTTVTNTRVLFGDGTKITNHTNLTWNGTTISAPVLTSTVAIGTAPLTVTSTTVVTNLNADTLDGQHGAYYAPVASPTFTGTVTAAALIVEDLTDGFVPYQKAADDKLSDSPIYTDGTNVSIGLTVPESILHTKTTLNGTNFPYFEKYASTDGVFTATRLIATKNSNMGDGFGCGVGFAIRDDAAVINPIGFIGAKRSGADNSGALSLYVYSSGVIGEKMTILPSGNIGTAGGTNPQNKFHIYRATGDDYDLRIGATTGYNLKIGYFVTSEYAVMQSYKNDETTYGNIVVNPLGGNLSIGGNTAPTALLDLGLAGTKLGVCRFAGSTSGNVTLQPNAVAGTDIVLTMPATTGTLVIGGGTATGANTADVTLASPNHGLGLSGQVITLGTPSTLTSATTNAVTTTSHTHAITCGIANTNIVKIDEASVADNDYAKFTANGVEGRTYAEVRSDLGLGIQTPQNLGATLSGSVTMDSASGYNAYGTLTGNITAFAISNAVAGDSGVIELTQGGSGSYTFATTMTKEGGALALSTAVGAVDVIGWYYNGSVFRLNIGKAFA